MDKLVDYLAEYSGSLLSKIGQLDQLFKEEISPADSNEEALPSSL
jgi:hypothetical protein